MSGSVIVAGARTPIGRLLGGLKDQSAADLGGVAIKGALENLPRQAKRLARWQARPMEARRPRLATPLRPGRPPGHRKRQTHEVDEILKECHWLALNLPVPNTS